MRSSWICTRERLQRSTYRTRKTTDTSRWNRSWRASRSSPPGTRAVRSSSWKTARTESCAIQRRNRWPTPSIRWRPTGRSPRPAARLDTTVRGPSPGKEASRSSSVTCEQAVSKLIIQIPCLNEAATLPATLADLPRSIPGIDVIETLVIDDGSRDGTSEVAISCGVHHVVRLRRNKGLAAAFAAGIDACVKAGADIIVNTDADNQYAGHEIPQLIAPLLRGDADICIGDRNIAELEHMSGRKRQLQRLGSWVVRQVSNTSVPDTTSGFRAYTREAALRMTVVSEFSYTLESIIQAGKKRMAIAHVPIAVNPRTRESRLFDSIFSYIKRSGATIVRIYAMYEPLKVFTYFVLLISLVGAIGLVRFFYYYLEGQAFRHFSSLVASGVTVILGFVVLLIGLLADLISANRKLLEDLVYLIRSLESPPREA